MEIERIAELELTAEDEAAIVAVIESVWGDAFHGRSFCQQRHHMRFLARQQGRVIGHIALGYRAVRLGGRLVDVTTLAEVCTLPEFQGRGVAAALLKEAIAVSRGSRAEALLLFGTAGLYAGHGFREVGNPIRKVEFTDARTGKVVDGPSDHLMVLDLAGPGWDGAAELDLLGDTF